MKTLSILACAGSVFIFFSCGNKTGNASIVGKWEYVKLDKAVTTTDADASKIDADNKGHTIEFFKDGKFVSVQANGDTLSRGTYEVLQGGKSLVTHTKDMASGGDSVRIADLTQAQLNFLTPNGDKLSMKRLH